MASYQYPYAEIGVSEGPYVHTRTQPRTHPSRFTLFCKIDVSSEGACFIKKQKAPYHLLFFVLPLQLFLGFSLIIVQDKETVAIKNLILPTNDDQTQLTRTPRDHTCISLSRVLFLYIHILRPRFLTHVLILIFVALGQTGQQFIDVFEHRLVVTASGREELGKSSANFKSAM